MTDDDLSARAREAAEVAADAHFPESILAPENEALADAFIEGYLAHAAQQPSRERIARVMREAGLYRRQADAILALFDGTDS